MTCAQMGGPADCAVVLTGNTAEEMTQNGMVHINAAHPDLAQQVKNMTPEETTAWMSDFQAKFDALPEM